MTLQQANTQISNDFDVAKLSRTVESSAAPSAAQRLSLSHNWRRFDTCLRLHRRASDVKVSRCIKHMGTHIHQKNDEFGEWKVGYSNYNYYNYQPWSPVWETILDILSHIFLMYLLERTDILWQEPTFTARVPGTEVVHQSWAARSENPGCRSSPALVPPGKHGEKTTAGTTTSPADRSCQNMNWLYYVILAWGG